MLIILPKGSFHSNEKVNIKTFYCSNIFTTSLFRLPICLWLTNSWEALSSHTEPKWSHLPSKIRRTGQTRWSQYSPELQNVHSTSLVLQAASSVTMPCACLPSTSSTRRYTSSFGEKSLYEHCDKLVENSKHYLFTVPWPGLVNTF